MKDRAAILEDLLFLASTGVGTVEAAERTGFPTAEALERWLRNHGQAALFTRLRAFDPPGAIYEQKFRRRVRAR